MTDTTLSSEKTFEDFLDDVAREKRIPGTEWFFRSWEEYAHENITRIGVSEIAMKEAAHRWGEHRFKEGMKADKWISVKSDPPEFDKPYLVYCSIYGRFIATYVFIGEINGFKHGEWHSANGEKGILPPIFYQELPALPSPINNKDKEDK